MATTTAQSTAATVTITTTMAEAPIEPEHGSQPQNNTAITTMFPESDSAITELQDALGPLLQARKDPKDSFNNLIPWSIHTPIRNLPKPVPYTRPGTFRLLDLPRELREEVYAHYLDCPSESTYRREHCRIYPASHLGRTISLFLVSKQVYDESYATMLRYNTLVLPSHLRYTHRHSHCAETLRHRGLLRLLPARVLTSLQKIRWTYEGTIRRWDDENHYLHVNLSASAIFEQILRDVHVFREYLPCLRVFDARWYARDWQFTEEQILGRLTRRALPGEYLEDTQSEEEKVGIWLEWMQSVVSGMGDSFDVRREVRLHADMWSYFPVDMRNTVVNEAYQKLVSGNMAMRRRRGIGDIEMSGKMWLEEMSLKKEDEWWTIKRRRRKRSSRAA